MKRHNSHKVSRRHEGPDNLQTSDEDTYTIIGFVCKNEPGTIYIPIVQLTQSQGEASRSEQRQDATIKHHSSLVFTADLSNQQNMFRQDSGLEQKRSEAPRQNNINVSNGKNNETPNTSIQKEKETIGKIGGNIMDCCHAFLGTTTHSAIMDGMDTVETVTGKDKVD